MSYELQIVSQLPQFNGKALKPWFVDGIDTIGVWGDEPFELVFKNRTNEKVQVRLSVDGTDVLTAKKAHTGPEGDGMWVVNAWGSMSLKAWPETTERGRAFVFGKESNSVAAHTHGDLSSKGIIAAAVFTEGYKPRSDVYRFQTLGGGDYFNSGGGMSYNSGGHSKGIQNRRSRGGLESLNDVSDAMPAAAPAVGAGQEMMQKISTAQGLVQPILNRVVRTRYIWWDDLEAKLLKQGFVRPGDGHPTGFPGDREKPLANLGSTPTMGKAPSRPPVQIYRFA
ncbi:MAG TPA: hypothetical protein VM577_05605 [Anaerovoracaceae bacterium]|nr:hypothetical protein [Anaerovoracaceae bacterium]